MDKEAVLALRQDGALFAFASREPGGALELTLTLTLTLTLP